MGNQNASVVSCSEGIVKDHLTLLREKYAVFTARVITGFYSENSFRLLMFVFSCNELPAIGSWCSAQGDDSFYPASEITTITTPPSHPQQI